MPPPYPSFPASPRRLHGRLALPRFGCARFRRLQARSATAHPTRQRQPRRRRRPETHRRSLPAAEPLRPPTPPAAPFLAPSDLSAAVLPSFLRPKQQRRGQGRRQRAPGGGGSVGRSGGRRTTCDTRLTHRAWSLQLCYCRCSLSNNQRVLYAVSNAGQCHAGRRKGQTPACARQPPVRLPPIAPPRRRPAQWLSSTLRADASHRSASLHAFLRPGAALLVNSAACTVVARGSHRNAPRVCLTPSTKPLWGRNAGLCIPPRPLQQR